jgi:hypothetical protein
LVPVEEAGARVTAHFVETARHGVGTRGPTRRRRLENIIRVLVLQRCLF